MKLHLPKKLFTALLAACLLGSGAAQQLDMPAQHTDAVLRTWDGESWKTADGTTVENPAVAKGHYVYKQDYNENINGENLNTSDGGGVTVEDEVSVTDMSMGSYGGTIYVGNKAYLNAWMVTMKSMDASKANVWVDGELNLRGLKNFGGGGENHNWHIGENGYINLDGVTALASNNNNNPKTWSIELIQSVENEPVIEGVVNRTQSAGATRTRTFIGAAGNLYGSVTALTVYDTNGNLLTEGVDYNRDTTVKGLGISYSVYGYAATDLTWNGGAQGTWVEVGSNWLDSGSSATSYLNGDNVTFSTTAAVTTEGQIEAGSMTVASGATLSLSASTGSSVSATSLNIQGGLTSSTGITVAGTVTMGTDATWSLTSGAAQSLTEAQFAGVSNMTVDTGASLSLTDITTGEDSTINASQISGGGTLSLLLNNNNGVNFNLSNFEGNIRVDKAAGTTNGRLQMNGSTLHTNATITLAAGGDLVFNGGSAAAPTVLSNNITVEGASSIYANKDDYGTLTGTVSGAGTITKQGSGTLNLNGTISVANFSTSSGTTNVIGGTVNKLSTSGGTTYATGGTVSFASTSSGTANISIDLAGGLVVTGGETNLTGDITIGTSNVSMEVDGTAKTRRSGIYGYTGTINVGDGTNATTVTTTRVEMGDISTANSGGVLNIKNNARLIVTGTAGDKATSSGSYPNVDFILGEWGFSSTMNVDGTLLAKGANLLNGDQKAIINVNNGGLLAVNSIGRNSGNGVDLTLEDGGKLILGSEGMQANSAMNAVLKAGTIGISADTVSITKDLTLSSTETGTTFDTQKYVWSGEGATTTIAQGTEGGTLSISGVISDLVVTTTDGEGDTATTTTTTTAGKLVKAGAGTLELSGANTYSGGTTISGGTVKTGNTTALGTGKVTVAGGNLELASGLEVSDLEVTSGTITFGNGTKLTVSEAITLDASAIKLAEGLTFSSTDAIDLIEASAGLTVNGIESWTGSSYTIGDVSYTTGLNVADNVLQLTFTKDTPPAVDSITTTVSDVDSLKWDGEMLTLNVGDNLADVGSVVVTGFDGGVLDKIFALDGMEANTLVGITLVGADGVEIVAEGLGAECNVGFRGPEGIYYGEGAGMYNVSYIPEPTTATLSLLALCGLAARRRRK